MSITYKILRYPGTNAEEILNSEAINALQNSDSKLTIEDFLIYLNSLREFDVLYYLMNEVVFRIDFSTSIINVSKHNVSKNMNSLLLDLLFKWTNSRWEIILSENYDDMTLKESVKTQFINSKTWSDIKNVFDQAKLVDILIKN